MIHYSSIGLRIGSFLLGTLSLIGMVINRKHADYSVRTEPLSNTGVWKDFIHPEYGVKVERAYQPYWFTAGFLLGGLTYSFSFIFLEYPGVKITGILFGLAVAGVGIFDLGRFFTIHEILVTASQSLFLALWILTYLVFGNQLSLILGTVIAVFLIIHAIQRFRNQSEYDPQRNILYQKVFIYLEVLFLALVPYFASA